MTLTFVSGRCTAINGVSMSPQEAMREANAIGGRNGIGIAHALENRIIGAALCGRGEKRRRPQFDGRPSGCL